MQDGDATVGSAVVPAVNAAHAAVVLRSLGRRGVHTIAAAENEHSPALWSRFCDERVAVPHPGTDATGYAAALLSLARRDDVETIVPLREEDVYALSHRASAFDEHVEVLWPSSESLTAVHDRVQLFDAAERAGVTVPDACLLTDVDSWDEERIVKGRYALLGNEYDDDFPERRVQTPAKTMFLQPGEQPDVQRIVDQMGHVPITQTFVDGTEYCLRALYHDGEPVATSQKRLLRGYKYSRGPSVYHEAVDIPELERDGLALLDELDWHGMASVGFIRDADGEFNLLEINPRYPASLPMDLHAGVDYPWYHWNLATNEEIPGEPAYRPGESTHLVRGELVHLHSVLREDNPIVERPSALGTVASMAASFVQHPTFDQLSLTDPGPFVRDTLNVASNLLHANRPQFPAFGRGHEE
ncbi:carboxylate--amine ligase [Halorubellus sp. JP-L1]|uniref:carboxylate--amine ligase n=1 Tax=Halorubellus sp. JP-L1 TaxID=2715753 RepID=UPI00187785F5|nr:carboxylate--amine ligase [Halorubellus sp. JP-L1]